jgi:hypothetical protein
MANPKVKFKRSSVANKRPTLANLELGELALNTYDGKLFTKQDTGGVGIATTVTLVNPWDENYGGGSITYSGIVTTSSGGGGGGTDYTEITVSGFSPSSFNQTYERQSTGFTLDTGTVGSGNALFNTNSNYYYYTATTGNDPEDRMIIFSEEDNAWYAVFSFNDPDYTSNNNNEALGSPGVDVFAFSIATGSDTADGRNVPPASDSNITYGTSSGGSGITTSRVGVVTITTSGDAEFVGVVTASSFSGNVTGNVTGNLTGTVLTASQTNITSVGTLGSLDVTNNITVGGTVDGRDVLDDGQAGDNLVTLSGVSRDSTDLGTFTGTTISDNGTIKAAIQELETAVDNVVGGNSGAASVLTQSTSTDASFFPTFVADNNGSATQESFKTDAGISYNPSTNILTVSGSVAANVTGNLTGNVTGNITGDITGDVTGTASTADTLKTVNTPVVNANHFITFVDTNNSTSTAEVFKTDDGLYYNPFLNQFIANGVNTGVLSLNSVDVTTTAAELNILDGATLSTSELNILDGVTATTAELNVLDGVTAFVDEDNMASDSATSIPSQQSVKAYVDSQVGAVDVEFGTAGDSGTGTVNTSQSLTISGTTNEIETSASGQTITIGLPNDVTVSNNLTVSGNVTIGGTLTYEDVNNVDSVGLVTARTGVRVTTGGVDISNGGLNVVGVATFNDNVTLLDNDKLKLGTGGDLEIYHDGSHSYIDDAGTGNLRLRSGTVEVTNLAGSKKSATFNSASGQELYYNNNLKFETTNHGAIVTGILTATSFVGNITGNVTGNADTATALQTARNIGGVSFDGTSDINLPGVNATGNQNTSGTAAGLSGSPNITVTDIDGTQSIISGVSTATGGFVGNLTGNVTGNVTGDLTGNADTATQLATARTIHGVSFDGTSNIDLSEVIQDTVGAMFSSNTETDITVTYEDSDGTIDLVVGTLNQDTTGTAALAEGLTGTPNITVGVVTASSLDISGNVDVDGTLEADAITIDGVSLAETISDTVGAMVSSNTETGISVTYDDSDNTLDFVIGTLNQDTTGNAATATALETARNIGGVSFDGTADINLPGVNASGNQDTSGNAATATQLATARTIAGVSFDGTSNISLNNNAITNGAGYITTSFTNTNQLTNGAGFITVPVTVSTSAPSSPSAGDLWFDPDYGRTVIYYNDGNSSQWIDASPVATTISSANNLVVTGICTATGFSGPLTGNVTGNVTGDLTGNADTATRLATARTIAGVSFDGTSNISLNNNAITNGANYITASDNISGTAAGLTGSPNITVTDITATGNVSIAGTLTYEDVNNVDSVGLITARTGVRVTTGGLEISAGGAAITGLTTVTGNISVSGTVDGRDIATDGSKLDGIEANATADQTASEILTAIKTVDGASSGLDADVLDGQEGTYYLNYNNFTNTPTIPTNNNELTNGASYITASDNITGTSAGLSGSPNITVTNVTAGIVTATSFVGDVTGNLTGNVELSQGAVESVTSTKTSTSEDSVDSFAAATYRSVTYDIQITRGSSYHTTTIKVLHDGTDTYMTEYGTMNTGSSLATFSSDINSGNVRLLATPSSATSTVFKIVKTLIKV